MLKTVVACPVVDFCPASDLLVLHSELPFAKPYNYRTGNDFEW